MSTIQKRNTPKRVLFIVLAIILSSNFIEFYANTLTSIHPSQMQVEKTSHNLPLVNNRTDIKSSFQILSGTCPNDTTLELEYNQCTRIVEYNLPVSSNNNIFSTTLKQNLADTLSGSYSCTESPTAIGKHLRVFDLATMGITDSFFLSSVNVGIGFANNAPEVTVNLYTLNGALEYPNMTLVKSESYTLPYSYNEIKTLPITAKFGPTDFVVAEFVAPGNLIAGYSIGETANSYIASDFCDFDTPVSLDSIGEVQLGFLIQLNGGNSYTEQIEGLPSGSEFPLGTTTNTYVFTDNIGVSDTCSFNVTIIDTQAPLLTCQSQHYFNVDENSCTKVVDYSSGISVLENCDNYEVTILSGPESGSAFPIGNTIISYMVEDAAGLTDTCFFEIVISDKTPPVFTCPNNIVVDAETGACSANVIYDISAEDLCSDLNFMGKIKGLPSGYDFPVGETVVEYAAIDAYGNQSTCSFTVTVNEANAPEFANDIDDITVYLEDSNCTATVDYTLPEVTDDCSNRTTLLKQNFNDSPTFSYQCDTFNIHKHLRVFDLNNYGISTPFNISSVDFGVAFSPMNSEVTVNLYSLEGALDSYDNLTLLKTGNITLPFMLDSMATIDLETTIPANTILVLEIVAPANLPGYNLDGGSEPTYFASDFCGNENPVNLATLGLENHSLIASINGTYSLPINITYDGLISGSEFPIGTTTTTIVAKDASGNEVSTSFDVTVIDTIAPTITCGENVNVISENCENMNVEVPVPSITDICGDYTLINDFNNLDYASGIYPVGSTIITWTATDAQGNSATCTQTVTVESSSIPTPNNTIQNVSCMGTNCDGSIDLGTVEGIISWSNGATTSTISDLCAGIYTVTITNSGCEASFEYEVKDGEAIEVEGGVSHVSCKDGNDGQIVLTGDLNGLSILWNTNASESTLSDLSAGTYTVTLTSTNGCTSNLEFTITEPDSAIDISEINIVDQSTNALGSIDLLVSGGTGTYTYSWSNGATTEDISDLEKGAFTCTITDENGCELVSDAIQVGSTVGIFSLIDKAEFTLSPNPTSSYLNLSLTQVEFTSFELFVYNHVGQKVINSIVSKPNSKIDVSNLESGIYYLQLIGNDGKGGLQKFVKQ